MDIPSVLVYVLQLFLTLHYCWFRSAHNMEILVSIDLYAVEEEAEIC